MFARKAILPDAATIEALIDVHVQHGDLLPRRLAEICENIRDFVVIEHDGQVIGCGALHLYGMHLAEIRSITVSTDFRRHGIGKLLARALLEEAKNQQVTCVCLFTRIPGFFKRLGFELADRRALPDKAYKDCQKCPRLNCCDEIAMVRGELPNFAILAPAAEARMNLLEISR
jgi:amino-acid N-acetyltransferase